MNNKEIFDISKVIYELDKKIKEQVKELKVKKTILLGMLVEKKINKINTDNFMLSVRKPSQFKTINYEKIVYGTCDLIGLKAEVRDEIIEKNTKTVKKTDFVKVNDEIGEFVSEAHFEKIENIIKDNTTIKTSGIPSLLIKTKINKTKEGEINE